jgi:2,4-dienoyl-CoA reductase-like NADH-dependent reductase (Old Yellow Enzyme family)
MSKLAEAGLFAPYTMRDGFELSNRLVFAPVYINRSNESAEFREFYAERARGGAGLIIAPVQTMGGFIDLYTPVFRKASRLLLDKCRTYGAWIIPQVFSGVGAWVNRMSADELSRLPDAFALCALKLREAGYPGMEIHGAHHSLFMHLLCPGINQRDDRYNGSLEARAALQVQTVKAIKAMVGQDFSLFYRLSATDFSTNGFDIPQAAEVARMLEHAGTDCLDISAGGTSISPKGSECPDHTQPEACFNSYFTAVKAAVTIPVIGVGRIATGECAGSILAQGRADLIALGRGLVADPFWPLKVKQRRETDIVSMDEWYNHMPGKRGADQSAAIGGGVFGTKV